MSSCDQVAIPCLATPATPARHSCPGLGPQPASRNTWVCDDGSVTTYHNFHESHPRFTEDLDPIWNKWGYFATTKAGR